VQPYGSPEYPVSAKLQWCRGQWSSAIEERIELESTMTEPLLNIEEFEVFAEGLDHPEGLAFYRLSDSILTFQSRL
jgi:hypothetical protein